MSSLLDTTSTRKMEFINIAIVVCLVLAVRVHSLPVTVSASPVVSNVSDVITDCGLVNTSKELHSCVFSYLESDGDVCDNLENQQSCYNYAVQNCSENVRTYIWSKYQIGLSRLYESCGVTATNLTTNATTQTNTTMQTNSTTQTTTKPDCNIPMKTMEVQICVSPFIPFMNSSQMCDHLDAYESCYTDLTDDCTVDPQNGDLLGFLTNLDSMKKSCQHMRATTSINIATTQTNTTMTTTKPDCDVTTKSEEVFICISPFIPYMNMVNSSQVCDYLPTIEACYVSATRDCTVDLQNSEVFKFVNLIEALKQRCQLLGETTTINMTTNSTTTQTNTTQTSTKPDCDIPVIAREVQICVSPFIPYINDLLVYNLYSTNDSSQMCDHLQTYESCYTDATQNCTVDMQNDVVLGFLGGLDYIKKLCQQLEETTINMTATDTSKTSNTTTPPNTTTTPPISAATATTPSITTTICLIFLASIKGQSRY